MCVFVCLVGLCVCLIWLLGLMWFGLFVWVVCFVCLFVWSGSVVWLIDFALWFGLGWFNCVVCLFALLCMFVCDVLLGLAWFGLVCVPVCLVGRLLWRVCVCDCLCGRFGSLVWCWLGVSA